MILFIIVILVFWMIATISNQKKSVNSDKKTDELLVPKRVIKPLSRLNVESKQPQINLSPDKQKIKDFVKKKEIDYLIHFTRYENLDGILTTGVVTREKISSLNYPTYVNDNLRLDGHRNSISLSISFPNYKMFYKYRKSTQAKGWVVIFISPEVLWEYNCAFCKNNAADSRMSNKDVSDLAGLAALEEMFHDDKTSDGTRLEQKLNVSDTTDPQAEVLVFGNILKKYILSVGFENQELFNQTKGIQALNKNIDFIMAKDSFNSRRYLRSLKRTSTGSRNHVRRSRTLLSNADNSLSAVNNVAISANNASAVLVVKSQNYLDLSKLDAAVDLKIAQAEREAEIKALEVELGISLS